MKSVKLNEYLNSIDYPGRGIAIGRTPCGKKMRIAYWIMGRSVNSQNRVFVEEDGGIRTQAYDPSKLEDPSLIIYSPVRVIKGNTIVTNGDQTDTIYDYLANDMSFEEALKTRTFEPDGPNYTPRISSLIERDNYYMSILKSGDGNGDYVYRQFFNYVHAQNGKGHVIHTYMHDGNPLPSFEGEPVLFDVDHMPLEEFSEMVWNSLNPEYRVSLFVRSINIENGETKTIVVNRHSEEK